jgi:hypothetical protein
MLYLELSEAPAIRGKVDFCGLLALAIALCFARQKTGCAERISPANRLLSVRKHGLLVFGDGGEGGFDDVEPFVELLLTDDQRN